MAHYDWRAMDLRQLTTGRQRQTADGIIVLAPVAVKIPERGRLSSAVVRQENLQ